MKQVIWGVLLAIAAAIGFYSSVANAQVTLPEITTTAPAMDGGVIVC